MSEPTAFSLLLPVYRGDRVDFLERAFTSSVLEQTRPPQQVVIVRDGPVAADLDAEIDRLEALSPVPVSVLRLPVNEGLAHALTRGLAACDHEVVARMDADDVSVPNRFERQLDLLERGDLDLVGTGMYEFDDDEVRPLERRIPPTGQERIRSYSRFHDPFNHPTVVYRRSAVERAGGYQELGLMEDYWLFARMIHAGAAVENDPEPLLLYRVGAGAYSRRGGWAQFRAEVRLQWAFRRIGFTTPIQFIRNVAIRAGYRLVPVGIRRVAYRRLIAQAGARGQSRGRVE